MTPMTTPTRSQPTAPRSDRRFVRMARLVPTRCLPQTRDVRRCCADGRAAGGACACPSDTGSVVKRRGTDRARRRYVREAGAHVFQTTWIGRSTPGRGRARASASIASRVARDRRAQASMRTVWRARRQVPRISPSTRSAPGHTREVQSRCLCSVRGTRSTRSAPLEQEVGVAARQQAHGRGGRLAGAHGRLVVGEQPPVAEWRSDREQRSFERSERRSRRAPRDSCPAGEPVGCGGPEDVEVASSELAACVRRIDLGSGDRPDRRCARAVPANRDRAGGRGVSERVRVHSERAPDLTVRHALRPEMEAQPLGHPFGPQAALGALREPAQREQREVALRDDIGLVTRSPELGERGMLPRRRLDPVDPRVQRQQRGPRHAVLQAGPRRTPQRLRALHHPLLEPADPSSERQDLLPGERQSRLHRNLLESFPARLRCECTIAAGPAAAMMAARS